MFKIIEKVLKSLLLSVLSIYKKFISPILPSACRYNPTCSEYTKEAIIKFGPFKGLLLGLLRILRCSPLFKGGDDRLENNLTLKLALKKYKEFLIFNKK